MRSLFLSRGKRRFASRSSVASLSLSGEYTAADAAARFGKAEQVTTRGSWHQASSGRYGSGRQDAPAVTPPSSIVCLTCTTFFPFLFFYRVCMVASSVMASGPPSV